MMRWYKETHTIIEAPARVVWEVLTDTRMWPVWGPSVKEVRCERRFIETGTTGSVRIGPGIWLPFKITRYIPETEWAWVVAHVEATTHRVEALTDCRCRLIFGVPAIAAPYLIVCRIAAGRIKQLVE